MSLDQSPDTKLQHDPVVLPLPRLYRRIIFALGCLVFLVAVPLFILYAIGYRFDPFATQNGITATGGLYIGILENEGNIYLNNTPTRGSRIFLNGVYLQNIEPGVQRVHVQFPDLQTWVKDLPVFPHIVTEVQAFLLPERPQVRVVTPTLFEQTTAVLPMNSAASTTLAMASSSNVFMEYAVSTSTTDYQANPESVLLRQLFTDLVLGTSTSAQTADVSANERFSFGALPSVATTTPATATIIATTTKEQDGRRVFLRDGELFAQYYGVARSIPEYFCVPNYALASSSELYGDHVGYGIDYIRKLNIFPQPPNREITVTNTLEGKVCRSEIRLDTKNQTVQSFYFLPNNNDFVVMHLEDGVYVIEIDDRAWQNVQPLYQGEVDALLVHNNRIYMLVGEVFFELYTTLHSS